MKVALYFSLIFFVHTTGMAKEPFNFGMKYEKAQQVDYTPSDSKVFIPHSGYMPQGEPDAIYYETKYLGHPALGYVEFFHGLLYLKTYDIRFETGDIQSYHSILEKLLHQYGNPVVQLEELEETSRFGTPEATVIWENNSEHWKVVLSLTPFRGHQRLLVSVVNYAPRRQQYTSQPISGD